MIRYYHSESKKDRFTFKKGKNFIKLSTESGFPDIYALRFILCK